MALTRAVFVTLAVLAVATYRHAQASSERVSLGRPEVIERFGVLIPVRDGIRIAADMYLPNSADALPAVLMITPYGRGDQPLRQQARAFARAGYVAVVADSRGRYDSGGEWDPFNPKHRDDGVDLVEWLAEKPWSNGKVGMWGDSYSGWAQWWTASAAPPELAAITPAWAPGDAFESGPYQHGALTGGWMPDWAAMMASRVTQSVDDGPYGGWQKRRFDDLKQTPYRDILALRGIEAGSWFAKWYAFNRSTDVYWTQIAYQDQRHYSKMGTPALNVTGWFDVSHSGAPMNYIGMRKFGATERARRPSLIIGPWTHGRNERSAGGVDYGAHAKFDLDDYRMRWFDHYLKGVDNGVENDPPVRLFVMGSNRWRTAQDWPLPETHYVKYFMTSGGRANSFRGDGELTTAPPRHNGSDKYVYDPRNPTLDPSVSYPNHNGSLDGAVDTHTSSINDDVLVYQTPPLTSDVEVIGPIEATLYASTSATDTDWMVRLVDVHPDGRALLLADGVLRARSRDPEHDGRFAASGLSTIQPGRVYEYTIRFWRGTANLFGRGHRIRVEISSSWFPFFLPNLNIGLDNAAMASVANAVTAQQEIFHGPRYASHIVLPVIPAAAPATDDQS